MASIVIGAIPIGSVDADAALVWAAQAGDRAAFGRLYERFARMVHGILLSHVAYSEVDDLQQDVFLLAMERLPSLRDPAAAGAWLATIARHAAADHHRRKRPSEELDERFPGKAAESVEARLALDALRALPETYRETLVLRLVEGMTGPEIAARTGLTPDSVRVNLCRGMKLLRERLGG